MAAINVRIHSFLLMVSFAIAGCGSGDTDDDTSTDKPPTFTEITAIVSESCAGVGFGCHNDATASGGVNMVAITEQDLLATKSAARITDELFPMPPEEGDQNPAGITLTPENKTKLLSFLTKK